MWSAERLAAALIYTDALMYIDRLQFSDADEAARDVNPWPWHWPCYQCQYRCFITRISADEFDRDLFPLCKLNEQLSLVKPLLESVFYVPASSAPVERVSSDSDSSCGLIVLTCLLPHGKL